MRGTASSEAVLECEGPGRLGRALLLWRFAKLMADNGLVPMFA